MSQNREKTFSKFSKKEVVSSSPKLKITMLGDSTIDNKIWVYPGIYGNAVMNKLGIRGASPRTRVRRSHNLFSLTTELSVVENLMDMLPNSDIRDFTNDGFTTTDCLIGNVKDKVFPNGAFREFPHELFEPLKEARASIEASNYIVLSVGGNNFREFLQGSFRIKDKGLRMEHIRNRFPDLVESTKAEYVKLLQKILEMNPTATLVLMTQYYPSFAQNDYKIYDFMSEVGSALHPDRQDNKAEDVIHDLVKQIYSAVLTAVQPYANRLVVADLTSSLNPYDPQNHVKQIEPSGIGGRRIASMLSHLMTKDVERGHVYQFSGKDVKQVALDQWTPKHPNEFVQHEMKSTLKMKR